MRKIIYLPVLAAFVISCSPSVEQSTNQAATPQPVQTASWTQTATTEIKGLQTPGPDLMETSSPLRGCEVLTNSQVEGIIGSLNNIQAIPSMGELIGNFEGCIYEGPDSLVSLEYGPFNGITARAYYDQTLEQYNDTRIETLTGLGESAYWTSRDEYTGHIVVLQENIVLSVSVSGENAREKALQIARIALARIPSQ